MADTTALSDIDALLYEMRGPLQKLYPTDHVLMAEWHGVGQGDPSAGRVTPDSTGTIPDDNLDIFSGNDVRFPLDLHLLEAGGWVSETGTVNEPIAPEFTKATLSLAKVIQPISITLEADEDSLSNSAITAMARLVAKAREALANQVNDAMNGNGKALLASADSTQGSAGGLVMTCVAVPDSLYVGKVVDVLTITSGADPGQGKRRKITAIDRAASPPTVTFSTTQQASDGGSGNITLANTAGIFVAGSYGNIMQGLSQAAVASGANTFQTVNRATYPGYYAADGRGGDTTVKPLSQAMMDAGVIIAERQGGFDWDFGIGDPSAINVYKASFYAMMRYNPETGDAAVRVQGRRLQRHRPVDPARPGAEVRGGHGAVPAPRRGDDLRPQGRSRLGSLHRIPVDAVQPQHLGRGVARRSPQLGLAHAEHDRQLRQPLRRVTALLAAGEP